MEPTPAMNLTNGEKDACTYMGLFGALIAITCLIQHIVITRMHWITFVMMALYLFSIVAFVTLTLLKGFSPLLLIASTVVIFGMEVFHLFSHLFSLILVSFLIYHFVLLAILFMGTIPQKLKYREAVLRAEELAWQDKI